MSPVIIHILEALFIFSVVSAVIVIVFENNNPARQLAWLMLVFFLPVLGLILYGVFGLNRRKRKIYSPQKSKKILEAPVAGVDLELIQTANLNESYLNLIRLLYNNANANPYKQNNIEILPEGEMAFASFIESMKNATDHIHLEFYIVGNDSISNVIREILSEKARAGVSVRLIYDYWGSFSISKKYLKLLKEAGVEVKPFLPIKFGLSRSHVNNRTHRKMIVVDGKTGFIGGMNIADRYLYGDADGKWRDTFVRVDGAGAHGIQRQFLEDWSFVSGEVITDPKYYPQPQIFNTNNLVQIVASGPDTDYPSIMHGIVAAIMSARKYIYIHTPYFIPNETLYDCLKIAAMSGIDVRLMIPLKADSIFSTASTASYLGEMLDAGVMVLQYAAGFLHSKTIVIDDVISIIGSSNLDERSFETNYEANAFIYDKDTALEMKRLFEEDTLKCKKTDIKTWNKRSKWQKLIERLMRLLSPLQ